MLVIALTDTLSNLSTIVVLWLGRGNVHVKSSDESMVKHQEDPMKAQS